MENKKRFFVLLVFFVISFLTISLVSSLDFTIHKNYDQKETLISKISGNFVDPVLEENIFFYKYYGSSEVYTSVDFELLRAEGNYYVYAQLDKSKGNYSVKIKNTRYYQEGDITDKNIRRNFTISNKTADFSIDPGVVKTEKDFQIELTNLRPDSIKVNVNPENQSTGFFSFSEFSPESKRQITLSPGEIREVSFELGNKTGLKTIKISSDSTVYNIPVYSIVKNDSDSGETANKSLHVYFSYNKLNLTGKNSILIGNKVQKIFTITNSEKSPVNISLKSSQNIEKYINLTKNSVSNLKAGNSKEIGMKILSNKIKKIKGNITLLAKSDNINDSSVMELYFNFINTTKQQIQNQTKNKSTKNKTGPVYSKTCSELGGQKCNKSSICTGQQAQAKDGECCLGKCELKGKDNTGKIIGWVIVIIVVLFLIWFYLVRYKGIRSKINLMDIAKGKKRNKSQNK